MISFSDWPVKLRNGHNIDRQNAIINLACENSRPSLTPLGSGAKKDGCFRRLSSTEQNADGTKQRAKRFVSMKHFSHFNCSHLQLSTNGHVDVFFFSGSKNALLISNPPYHTAGWMLSALPRYSSFPVSNGNYHVIRGPLHEPVT